MLEAFIDDSKGQNPPGVFILAGYVMAAERWAAFSDEWKRVRDASPKIQYFKLREAQRQNEQFYRWEPERCNEKIALFRGVIEQFEPSEVCIGFRIDAHKEAFGRYGKKFENPYYFAIGHLTGWVAKNLENLGLENQPIKFIFDKQPHEMHKAVEAWEWAVSQKALRPHPSNLLSEIWTGPPNFDDDVSVMPLQAADMHATHMRQHFEALMAKKEPPKLPGFTKQLKGGVLQYNKQQMTELADQWPELMRRLRD
jgi:hypothetical protein